jgi:hypothetical protein
MMCGMQITELIQGLRGAALPALAGWLCASAFRHLAWCALIADR